MYIGYKKYASNLVRLKTIPGVYFLFVLFMGFVLAGCHNEAVKETPPVQPAFSTTQTIQPSVSLSNSVQALEDNAEEENVNGLDNNDEDIELYAEKYGISTEEARERIKIREYLPDGFDEMLLQKEPESFGGLWIQNNPEYKIILAFTSHGTELAAQYVPADLAPYVEIRTVKYTEAELMNDHDTFIAFIQNQKIPFNSAIDIRSNCIETEIQTDYRARFEKLVQDNNFTIPETIHISYVDDIGGLD